jgi:hypothetical protein
VPVLGFTWYSLTDQIDWDIGLTKKRGTVNACGLYDLKRKPRPWRPHIAPCSKSSAKSPSCRTASCSKLQTVPARLKVEV